LNNLSVGGPHKCLKFIAGDGKLYLNAAKTLFFLITTPYQD